MSRKLRNRLSQRAFRRRQAEYLRDLRNRAEASQKPDNERVAELEEENGRLRAHITELQSRLEGVQVTLQVIASSSSKILSRPAISLPRQPQNEKQESEHEEDEPSGATLLLLIKCSLTQTIGHPFLLRPSKRSESLTYPSQPMSTLPSRFQPATLLKRDPA